MKIIEALVAEHDIILAAIGNMERQVKASPQDFLAQAPAYIQFIQEFADAFHHGKEENILFKVIGEPGVLAHCNPVPQMFHEHKLGRDFLQRMQAGVDAGDASMLAEGALAYGELLRSHIFKENNILFPMAQRSLSPAGQQAVDDELAEAGEPTLAEKVLSYQAVLAG